MTSRMLSRDDLEQRITDFMATEGMCVLATCSMNVPRASAVEFFPAGTTLYILTEGGRKVENISENPVVSVAIHTQFIGWERIRGIQLTGIAEIGRHGSAIFSEGEAAYRKRKGEDARSIPEELYVIRITPVRIEFLDMTLKAEGLLPKHEIEYPVDAGRAGVCRVGF